MDTITFFERLQLAHIDEAIKLDLAGNFPRDVIELARVMLRTVALIKQDFDEGAVGFPAQDSDIRSLIGRCTDAMLVLETRRLAGEGFSDEEVSSCLN